MKKSKWTDQKIARLITEAACKNKSAVFSRFAAEMGLQPASVRNFYYKNATPRHKKPFAKFTKLETLAFLREIVLGYSRGSSIRAVCMRLCGGDNAKFLRYQNKYRTILRTSPELIEQTIATLEVEGFLTRNPIKNSGSHAQKSARFGASRAKNPHTDEFKTLLIESAAREMPDNIIEMPLEPNFNNLSDQDIQNLFMGVVRLVRKQASGQIETLKNEIERLKTKSQDKRTL